ncbi:lipid droplet-regulating VLDL assembly factor AUP1-like [Arctopsyche grandis]|uniref:lipid droplet-regulating VLDL assembly factor AUP1-like n=1 Tax=Arctopsyche grandis TaxID=121162 RepID=UPI00406D67BF
MWNPYTAFHIHLLPVVERADKESSEDFANRTQKIIADFLKIEATEYSNNELRELVAARDAEQNRISTSSGTVRNRLASPTSIHPDLQRMAAQVKEILPAVPLSVITKDLGRTQSIDVTLTNILEGIVPYTPEETCEQARESPAGPSQPLCPPPPLRTAAATFPRTAHDRQLSYQERKAQLIEAARRRYIEKHGLKNC